MREIKRYNKPSEMTEEDRTKYLKQQIREKSRRYYEKKVMNKFNNPTPSDELKIMDEVNGTQKEEIKVTDKTTDIITACNGYGIYNKRYTITPPIKNKAYTELIEKIKNTTLKGSPNNEVKINELNEPNNEAKITF